MGCVAGMMKCATVVSSNMESGVGDNDDDDNDDSLVYKYPLCDKFFSSRVLVLAIFSVLFTLFTVCMLIDQSEAIRTNVNAIGRMKKRKAGKGLIMLDISKRISWGPISFDWGRRGDYQIKNEQKIETNKILSDQRK